MYKGYFGFHSAPFELNTDTQFLYLSPGHARARACLEYALYKGDGLAVITGEIGAGKSTLIRELTERPHENTDVVVIGQPRPDPEGFLESLLAGWDRSDPGDSRRKLLAAVRRSLATRFAWGIRTVLVIDEAQVLSRETLNELRLLVDDEIDNEKPLSVVLVGQPCLAKNLAGAQMEQFRQRVRLSFHLSTLNRQQTQAYIHKRVTVAGAGSQVVFANEAIPLIHRYTGGVPRLINVLCDLALTSACLSEAPRVGPAEVREAVRELGWVTFGRRQRSLALPGSDSRLGAWLSRGEAGAQWLSGEISLAGRALGSRASRWARRSRLSVQHWLGHTLGPALGRWAVRSRAWGRQATITTRTGLARLQGLVARHVPPPSAHSLQLARGVSMGLVAALALGAAFTLINAPSTRVMSVSGVQGPAMLPDRHPGGTFYDYDALSSRVASMNVPPPPAIAPAATPRPAAQPAVKGPLTTAPSTALPDSTTPNATSGRPLSESIPTFPPAPVNPTVALSSLSGLDGADWLLAQPSDQFVIQILATNQREVLDRFLSGTAKDLNVAYYRRLRNDQEWHVLVTGLYPDIGLARQASVVLPDNIRVTRPWVRPMANVQADIRDSLIQLNSLAAL